MTNGQLGHDSHIMHLNSSSNLDFLHTCKLHCVGKDSYDQELIHVPFLESPTLFGSPLTAGGLD
jgi:hypothetical protein